MAKGHTVTVERGADPVEVTIGGEVVARSDRPLLVHETGLPVRVYLPQEDVRMDLFEPTSTRTTCPFKGEASYWTYTGPGERREDVVWGYPDPIDSVPELKGHVSFYDTVAVISTKP
ncbi:DUF427 domain-containing protein [Actinokineospora bangkokensis]|uniref:Aminotransferase n=1 Tax=Actinokineospora bangkokensis TaxID=1193682 RepID=A0A1Q9LSP5_9PSEU|nr:DUF427 domain-containing protein [Actinokineospora bangkokensis]OLR95033.1 aminotransferase [Actinokineospora bangkokensis]